MGFAEDIHESKFSLLILREKAYFDRLAEIIRTMKAEQRIAYVCLSRPYADVLEEMKKHNVDPSKIFFIDILSSHYKKPKPRSNCVFLKEPLNLNELKKAISDISADCRCTVIFDSISALFMLEQNFSVVKFTHEMTLERKEMDSKTIYVVLKDSVMGDGQILKDLSMFTDKTVDLSSQK